MNKEKGGFDHPEQQKPTWERIITRYIPRIALGMLIGAFLGFTVVSLSTRGYERYHPEAFTTKFDNFVITHPWEVLIAGAVIGGILAGYATYRKLV